MRRRSRSGWSHRSLASSVDGRHRPGRHLQRSQRRTVPGRDLGSQPQGAGAYCASWPRRPACKRYILPSSCSIYGFQDPGVIADETTPTNPLTTYAKANEQAEHGVLPLADDSFCVVVLRQATVYGYQPAHALRSGDQRHDLRRLEDRHAAADARRQPVAADGPCPRHRVRADLHADGARATR